MAKKLSPPSLSEASNDSLTEMDQLRQIVFGQAKIELDQKLSALNQRLTDEMNMLQDQFNQRIDELSTQMNHQHKELLGVIADTQSNQDDNKADFIEANKQLLSQLEMAENAAKDDAEAIHKRIDSEVSQLDSNMNQGLEEMLERLDLALKELANSKTDRKKLASLLANMATNLESNNE